ncbi:cache domain-containing protein [Geobacter sp. OR-1]|uniref:cache domain-containing protein n=1 Tax=Geobacter sp. OR-1 TaxID=1266765 RepID=UPI001364C567|nr:cache domain-containing protein [Geobacter sp. OR-1]
MTYSAHKERQHDLFDATLVVERLAGEIKNDQEVLLAGAEQLLSAISYLPAVQQRDSAKVNRLLAEMIRTHPQISNFVMFDANGSLWASAVPVKEPMNAGHRRFFRNAVSTGRFSSGEYIIGRLLNQPIISFAYPFKDNGGRIRDVGVISLSLSHYDKKLKISELPQKTSLTLFDHKGTILFHNILPDLIGRPDRPDHFRFMQAGPDEGTFAGSGNLNIPRIFAYKKLRLDSEATPYMYVRTGIPAEIVSRRANSSFWFNIVVLTFSTAMVVALAAYICKRGILDKIALLLQATRQVSKGNLNVRISDHVSGGELGELGRAFDAMSEALISNRQQLTALSAELALAEEKERRRLAVELHDQIGQTLAFAKIKLDSHLKMHGQLPANDLAEVRRLVEDSIRSVRSLTLEISPPLLYEVGLGAALETLGERFQAEHGFLVELRDDRAPKPLREEVKVTIFQMVRELLVNVAKHARAQNVVIEIVRESNELRLTVRDDGIGFDSAKSLRQHGVHGGFGLLSICQRIEHLDGRVYIDAKIGLGSNISLWAPLDKNELAEECNDGNYDTTGR